MIILINLNIKLTKHLPNFWLPWVSKRDLQIIGITRNHNSTIIWPNFGLALTGTCNGEDSQDSTVESKDRLSLRSFRYGLNQILKTCGHLYNITNKRTASFQKCQQAFIDALKELKSEGKGDVDSYPEIEEQGKT